MTEIRSVRIKTNGFGTGTVWLNGVDVSTAVRGVSFESRATAAGDCDMVRLDLAVNEIEITALADRERTIMVDLRAEVVELLTRLGWTPPADGATTYRIPHEPVCVCSQTEQFANGHHRTCPAYVEPVCTCSPWNRTADDGVHGESCPLYRSAYSLPPGCRCFELDSHERYFETGEHDERCPLFITDNQSPDAND